MPRVKNTGRRDSKGRILPPGISERVKEGRYIFRIQYDGEVYKPIYDSDLSRLKKRAEIMRAEVLMNKHLEPTTMTLNDCFKQFLEWKRTKGMKEISLTGMRQYYEWYIMNSTIGKRRVQKLERGALVKYLSELQVRKEAPLSYGTVKRVGNIVENVLEYALMQDFVGKNVAYKLSVDVPEIVEQKEREAIPEAEVVRFLSYVKHHKFYSYHYNLLVVLLGTGMRVGELCALCESDVQGNHIEIYKTLSYRSLPDENGKDSRVKYIGGTKTENGVRTIPMGEAVRRAIARQRKFNKDRLHKCVDKVPTLNEKACVKLEEAYSDFLFYNQNDTSYTPDYVTLILKKIIKSFNRDEKIVAEKERREPKYMMDFTSHYFRHTFATRMSEAGVSYEHISKWLGHGSGSEKKKGARATKIYIHNNWQEGYKVLEEDLDKLNSIVCEAA
ncbi:MAG: tyrosine-type recombinase/integrase [Eubacteriales bacterium]|nr:tyrosine-type recombinase/integrase [Eubacteriales bacterium]